MSRCKAKGVPVVQGLLGGDPFILALDISSTTIGAVFLKGQLVLAVTTEVLKGDLYERIFRAAGVFDAIVSGFGPPDVLAYEGPAYKVAPMALIAQQRVVGVILHCWHERYPGRPLIEIAPMAGKVALAGDHGADKESMIACAKQEAPVFASLFTEHAADAMGVGLSAWGKLKQARLAAEAAS